MAMLTDHVQANTPKNLATLKTTSTKVKELSKGQCRHQHGHVRDHVNINTLSNMTIFIDHVQGNTPWNVATLKITSTKVKELSKGQRGHQHGRVPGHVHCQKHISHSFRCRDHIYDVVARWI
ncbi:unnamed protein product [Linum trigynum]|uniref:Uncharacterized protein n=1 Tax=Linum trigynum TaxID=586398 RepID=A0AAV2E0P4_9ROSI